MSEDKEGDQRKLNLTFRMMLGLRVAVGRQGDVGVLEDDDFTQVGRRRLKLSRTGGDILQGHYHVA